MIHTTLVALPPDQVLARAKAFFRDRVPASAAFVEQESPRHVTLRGQGGEEVVISATADGANARVRASTLMFDQALDRFLSTLPLAAPVDVA